MYKTCSYFLCVGYTTRWPRASLGRVNPKGLTTISAVLNLIYNYKFCA